MLKQWKQPRISSWWNSKHDWKWMSWLQAVWFLHRGFTPGQNAHVTLNSSEGAFVRFGHIRRRNFSAAIFEIHFSENFHFHFVLWGLQRPNTASQWAPGRRRGRKVQLRQLSKKFVLELKYHSRWLHDAHDKEKHAKLKYVGATGSRRKIGFIDMFWILVQFRIEWWMPRSAGWCIDSL